jgi:hypothetical protein
VRASWRLPQALIVELRSHRVRQVVEQLHAGPASTEQGLLFSTQAGMPLDPRNALRSLTTTAAPVGLTDIGLHSPRHAAASALISSGAHLEVVQELLGHSSYAIMIRTCAALRPAVGDPLDVAVAEPLVATKVALRSLARRYQQLTEDIAELDGLQTPLIAALNPTLLTRRGVGVDAAGQLLVTAGDNPDRLRQRGGLCSTDRHQPVPASSGRTQRHRLNRGGDRNANCTLYRIVLSRLRYDPRTQDYVRRRTTEGLSKKEIIRCLKRYIAREIFYNLIAGTA